MKAASTNSSIVEGLQLDILLRTRKQICEFSSLSLFPLSRLGTATARTHLARKKKKVRWRMENRRRNEMKALSLLLFKEKAQQLEKDEGLGRKTLSLPPFNADGTRWDAS